MLTEMIVNTNICFFSRKFNTAILETNLEDLLSLLWDEDPQMRSGPQLTTKVLCWWLCTPWSIEPCTWDAWFSFTVEDRGGMKGRLGIWRPVLSEDRAREPRTCQVLLSPGAPVPCSTSVGRPWLNPRWRLQTTYGWENGKRSCHSA